MKCASRSVFRAMIVGSSLLTAGFVSAQNGPASSVDEPVNLSPFEVTATAGGSYLAESTLGSTRIRTDLRDVGSAISVATKEFMRDLGATDASTLLPYLIGAEIGGVHGNFLLGSAVGDGALIDDSLARQDPHQNTRIRSLRAADNTRDFFLTDIPFDTYNTSRIDLLRGANSILFGNGSGAGIVNAAADSATLGNNATTITTRLASYGSLRGSVNINRELRRDELALRMAALWDETHFRQKPAFQRDRRYYGAVRWEPKFLRRGSARTSMRFSLEAGEIAANRPRLTTPSDALTPWFISAARDVRSPTVLGRATGQDQTLLGVLRPMIWREGYDPFVTHIAGEVVDPARRDVGARAGFDPVMNPNAEAWLGASSALDRADGFRDGVVSAGPRGWEVHFDDPRQAGAARLVYPAYGNAHYHAVNPAGERDGQPIAGLRVPDITGLLRLDQYASAGAGSFLYGEQGLWRANTLSDPSVFDFFRHLVDGPNKGEGAKFSAFNATLDQTFWNDRFGFQLAFDSQDYRSYRWALFAHPTLTMDVYRYLPAAALNEATGLYAPLPNPNFGRPFLTGEPRVDTNQRARTTRRTERFTPYVDFDFTDLLEGDSRFTRFVGRHTFTGFFERFSLQRESTRWQSHAIDPWHAEAIFGPGRTIDSVERRIAPISYLGPSVASAQSMSGLKLTPILAQQYRGLDATPRPAHVFDSRWAGALLPGAADDGFLPPALGLAPNAIGGGMSTQNENPRNYVGWTTSALPTIAATLGFERALALEHALTKTEITSYALVDQWRLFDENLVVTAGLRRDTIKTFLAGDPGLAADALARTGRRPNSSLTGAVDWSAPFVFPSSPGSRFKTPWLKTAGAVMHSPRAINRRLPWRLTGSLFYSRSENMRAEPRRNAITGEELAPPAGNTRDYGFALGAFDGRVSFRATRYTASVRGATLPDNSLLQALRDEVVHGIRASKSVLHVRDLNLGQGAIEPEPAGNEAYHRRASTLPNGAGGLLGGAHWFAWEPARVATTAAPWTLSEWQAEEAHAIRAASAFLEALRSPTAQRFLVANNIETENWRYGVAQNGVTSAAPAGAAITGDTAARGDEFELYLRPADHWNIALHAAKSTATQMNLARDVAEWIERRAALYRATDLLDAGRLAGDLRWFDGSQRDAWAHARFFQGAYRLYSEFSTKDNHAVPELRPWRYQVVTNYMFRRGALKGVFIGGAHRWEDKSIIGFGVTEAAPATANEPAIGRLDADKPFYGPRERHLDLWFGATRRIAREVEWRVQLNLSNVGERARLLPVTVNPDGSAAAHRIAEGMTWRLTNTFSF